ncbi:hypothetical protein AS181_06115 [Gordonia sp. SGD-V-85]|nr:hypothetical protein AS181_06115 [Gordonia sp. SGD-V-85]MBR7190772.1 hypothetical protein [Gordonia sp. SCSIO 19800]SCC01110.1 hypothetical protein GA0061091_104129 [Gordonia sp. v-85]
MYTNSNPQDPAVLAPVRLRPAHDLAGFVPAGFVPAGFVPVDPIVPPARPGRPGLRASLTSWAANTIGWVAFATAAVLFLLALGHAMAGEPADGYGVAALVAFGVGVLATIAACAGLVVSFVQRVRHGAFRRPGVIADAIVLSSVTAFSVLTALYPLAFVLAAW